MTVIKTTAPLWKVTEALQHWKEETPLFLKDHGFLLCFVDPVRSSENTHSPYTSLDLVVNLDHGSQNSNRTNSIWCKCKLQEQHETDPGSWMKYHICSVTSMELPAPAKNLQQKLKPK